MLPISKTLKVGGKVYIFEPTFRELHQIPDDYIRYTPYGLTAILKKNGFEVSKLEETGGAFSAIAYCWVQALEYFPKELKSKMEKWFYQEHFKELMEWDGLYKENYYRAHTAFPTAFSIEAIKQF